MGRNAKPERRTVPVIQAVTTTYDDRSSVFTSTGPSRPAQGVDFQVSERPYMTMKEAARQVLASVGHAIHIRALVVGIQNKGVGVGRSFEPVRASLTPILCKEKEMFRRVQRGYWTLVQK